MKAGTVQVVALLLLLLAAQVQDSVHGISHVTSADDQACSQCLHGRPKQHAAPPVLQASLSGPGAYEPALVRLQFSSPAVRLSPKPRGPPPAG